MQTTYIQKHKQHYKQHWDKWKKAIEKLGGICASTPWETIAKKSPYNTLREINGRISDTSWNKIQKRQDQQHIAGNQRMY